MKNVMMIFELIIISFPVFFSLTNTLIFPLSLKRRFMVLSYLVLFTFFSFEKYSNFTVIFLLIGSLILILIFRKHAFINLSSSLIGYFFSVCLNYIFFMFSYHINITYDLLKNKYLIPFSIVFSIITYISTYFLGKFLRYLYFKQLSLHYYENNLSKRLYLLFLFELIACFIIYIFNIAYGNFVGYSNSIIAFNGMLFLFFFLFTAVIFFLIIRTIKKDNDLTIKLKEYDALQKYTARVENLYMEIRTFKHDYINLLSTLHVFIEEKRFNEMETYFEESILPTGQNIAKEDAILGRLSCIKVIELKALLYTKLISALNKHLNISVTIGENIDSIPMDSADLIRVVGILLDNAIEASLLTESRKLSINFFHNPSVTIISISNACVSVPNLEHIFDLNYSTKSSSRGIGLHNVRSILNRYPHILLHTCCENLVFIQELEILS